MAFTHFWLSYLYTGPWGQKSLPFPACGGTHHHTSASCWSNPSPGCSHYNQDGLVFPGVRFSFFVNATQVLLPGALSDLLHSKAFLLEWYCFAAHLIFQFLSCFFLPFVTLNSKILTQLCLTLLKVSIWCSPACEYLSFTSLSQFSLFSACSFSNASGRTLLDKQG